MTPPPEIRLDLIEKYNVPGPRYTSYPTAIQFSEMTPPNALIAEAAGDFERAGAISIYAHLPFCESQCHYCACSTIITKNHEKSSRYLNYLEKEIALWKCHFTRIPRVAQLHFGGGTPTFLSPDEIKKLGAILHENFDILRDAEVSVEIDPRRLTEKQVRAFREIGATRASLGVQDFNAAAQKSINRIQSFETTANAVHWLRSSGFSSINFDLIYGLPHQTPVSFSETLNLVKKLSPDRLAVFSYAHVPWLKPSQKIFDREGSLPSPSQKMALLKLVISEMNDAGFVNIGMDHFARDTDELAIAQREKKLHRNFQGYSTKAGLSILGLGVTSISQTHESFRQNEKELDTYFARLDNKMLPIAKGVFLTDEDKIRREIIMQIMCNLEIDFEKINTQFGVIFREKFASELTQMTPLADDGLVILENEKLCVLPAGRLFIRNIAMVFDAYLKNATGRHSKTV